MRSASDPPRLAPDPDEVIAGGAGSDLGRRSARGGAAVVGAQLVQLAVGVISVAVLARLLSPRAFGLFFMVTALTDFTGSVRDFGFPMATVHQRALTRGQLSALFWVNLRLNALLSGATLLAAPLLAAFFGEPSLVALTVVLEIGLFLDGTSVLQLGLLRRRLSFGTIAGLDILSLVTGVAAGIAAALAGLGFWALAVQHLTLHCVHAAGLWLIASWRPLRPGAGGGDVGELRRYSRDVTWARMWSHVGRNLDRLVVGRIAGAAALGLYQNAYRWSIMPVQQVFTPLLTVMVATFSRVKDDTATYRTYFRAALLGVLGVTLPALAFAFVMARPLVLLLLGDQWVDAVPLFRILLPAAACSTAGLVVKWVNYSEGHTRRQLRWSLTATAASIAGVLVGAAWGVTGVAAGYTVAVCAATYPGVRYCFTGSRLAARDYWSAAARPAAAALFSAAALFTVRPLMPAPGTLVGELALAAAVFAAVYAATWTATRGGRHDLATLLAVLRRLRADPA